MLIDPPKRLRCAVYTRKSTDDRLERDFNTLASQREVCSAYITSQRHKGWLELAQHYDDAGQSGGSIDRPALQELMRDIELGRIDVIVIYKIDRLTRSLADFVRLMDLFERYAIAFVSVTQAFDTSDSMGRLVLNILLTFAQFEREMIADRIRDKYAAMRKRGKYVGGVPPYGYDVVERRLVPNAVEAQKVREIFDRFLALGSYSALCDQLQAEGMRTKVWTTSKGNTRGGQLVSNGMVYAMLGNCIYAGQVAYQGQCYDGEHEAILPLDVWQRTQALRAERAMYRPNVGPSPNILLGLLYDCHGRKMVICDERKRDRPYRYYASEQAHWGVREGLKRYRTRAHELEELVLATLSETLCDREKVRAALLALGRHGPEVEQLSRRGAQARHQLETASLERCRDILVALIVRGEVAREHLKIVLRCAELARFVAWDGRGIFRGDRAAWSHTEPTLLLELPVNAVRFERSLVMPIEPADPSREAKIEPGLVRLIHEARRAQAMVDAERDTPVASLARRMERRPGFFSRILRLNYLAPDIIAAVLDGTQPAGLTRKRLINANLPLDWAIQRRLFGFAPRPDHQRGEQRF